MEEGEEEAEARSRTAAEERHKLQALARANLRRETVGAAAIACTQPRNWVCLFC
jgi:hypothetical protein